MRCGAVQSCTINNSLVSDQIKGKLEQNARRKFWIIILLLLNCSMYFNERWKTIYVGNRDKSKQTNEKKKNWRIHYLIKSKERRRFKSFTIRKLNDSFFVRSFVLIWLAGRMNQWTYNALKTFPCCTLDLLLITWFFVTSSRFRNQS